MSRPGVGEFFDTKAAGYDTAYDACTADGHALRARMAVALRLLGAGPGRVLDAGMGPGRLLAELVEQGWEASGIDESGEMVALARRRLPGARLEQGTIEKLPFPDDSFDAVIATGVLEYADLERALAELARVLSPGGQAVLSYPNRGSAYGLWKTRVFYRAVAIVKRLRGLPASGRPAGSGLVRLERFADLLRAAGLTPEAVEHASFLALPSPLELMLPRLAVRLGERLEGSGPRVGRVLATQLVVAARKQSTVA
jgi:ubiquinone/menaquinone biosynthesis C-methylase UbiE